MHRIVDSQGGLYLDADALADAGFAAGRPVHVRIEDGRLVLTSQPLVTIRERVTQPDLVAPDARTA